MNVLRNKYLSPPYTLPSRVSLGLLMLLAGTLGGCHYMDNQSSAKPAPSRDSSAGADPQSYQEVSYTLSDKRLSEITERQDKLLLQLSLMPETADTQDFERRATEIARDYQSFLADNPDNIIGYILYGKFLRNVGERELANVQFVLANRIDPNVAVVKQQIGNYLAEEGVYDLALPYVLAAIELDPQEARYHFQLGELLYTYGAQFVASGMFERDTLDTQMMDAFEKAMELDPANRDFQLRYAEAHYDIKSPDWQDVLVLWTDLRATAGSDEERDVIQMHRARALIKLNRSEEARTLLEDIERPALQQSKKELIELIQTELKDKQSRITISSSGS